MKDQFHNEFQNECNQIQRLVFELEESIEQTLSETERQMVETHLAKCHSCQELRQQERQLNSLLKSPRIIERAPARAPTRSVWSARHVLSTIAVATTASLAVGMLVWSYAKVERAKQVAHSTVSPSSSLRSWGSMVRRPVIRNATYNPEPQDLQSANHIELPTGDSASIDLAGAGQITVVGPAIVELDRIGGIWKLTILEGQVSVSAEQDGQIRISTRTGTTAVSPGEDALVNFAGEMILSAILAINQEQEEQQEGTQEETKIPDLATLQKEAFKVFHSSDPTTEQDMKRAAEMLKQLMEHADASESLKIRAEFYRAAALANAKMTEEALQAAEKIYSREGDQTSEVIWFIMAESNLKLGHKEKARKQLNELLEAHPETPYAPMARSYLGGSDRSGGSMGATRRSAFEPAATIPFTTDRKATKFNEQQKGYLVVEVGLQKGNADHDKFSAVAKQAQSFHEGQRISFNGQNFLKLRQQIEKLKPKNVLFVVPPQLLDVNLHRQILKIAPTLDNDLFADFSWGYLTARDGETVQKLWQRIEQLHENGLANKSWLETAVVGGGMKSVVNRSNDTIPNAARAAGFEGKQIYFGTSGADPDVMKFVDENLSLMEQASVIAMTGNGDPQGIWLFDDSRNADPDQHWQFDKDRVGEDADGKLTRIKADRFRKLELDSPVIWSGTCHSGASCRVYVESDIVSTFGSSDKTELYELPPDESFCLALIDAGAGALLVPVASNHGMSVSMENDFVLSQGATLGQAIGSTYNDVFMQAGGVPALAIAVEGEATQFFREPIMQGAGANRILIGDPALSLFERTPLPHENSTITFESEQKTATVVVEWKKSFHARGWNIFADGTGGNRRVFSVIDCSDLQELREIVGGSGRMGDGPLHVTAKIVDAEGKEVVCEARAELEIDGEKTWLHVQASANDDNLMYEQNTATFEIGFKK